MKIPLTFIGFGVSRILPLLIVGFFVGCSHKDELVDPSSGDCTVQITVHGQDEFGRASRLPGITDILLLGKDRTLHASIPRGDSTYTFTNLPYQKYVATLQQSGYYSASVTPYSYNFGSFVGETNLYPSPSSMVRIDSILCFVNSVVPQIHLRLFCAQTLPAGGYRSAIVFAGLWPDVNPWYTNYVYSQNWIAQVQGASVIETEIYRGLREAGVPSGTRVYLTARLTSGATVANQDPETGLLIFSNLENNTKAVVSFIMP